MNHILQYEKYLVKRHMCVFMLIGFAVLFAFSTATFAEDKKPLAVIDGTLNVAVGKTVYLDGSLSSDPGGANLDYRWALIYSPSGSQAIIMSSSDPQASFEADVAGKYKVKLTVNNGLTDSAPAYAEITVTE